MTKSLRSAPSTHALGHLGKRGPLVSTAMSLTRAMLPWLLALISMTAAADVARTWAYYPGISAPGVNGFAVVDLDGDGAAETVATASGGLAVLRPESVGQEIVDMFLLEEFQRVWGSIQVDPSVSGQFWAALGDSGGNAQALVAYTDLPLREVRRLPLPAGPFSLHQIVDVDGDGDLEALGLSGGLFPELGKLTIIDLESGHVEWTDTVTGQFPLAGQLDDDAALEIIFGGDLFHTEPGRVLDGATRDLEWTYPDGFAGRPVIGNFHGSADRLEFGIFGAGFFRIFVSEPIYSPLREFTTSGVGIVLVHDFDLDGLDDLIGLGNLLKIYSMASGTEIRSTPGMNQPRFAVLADVGLAPGLDIVSNGNMNSTENLEIWSLDSGLQQFDMDALRGPFSALLHADLNGDGSKALAFTTQRRLTGVSGLRLIVLNEQTGVRMQQNLDYVRPFGENYLPTLLAYDAEGNGRKDIAVTTYMQGGPAVIVLRGTDLQPIWQHVIANAEWDLTAAALLDQNQDGTEDLVVATAQQLFILDGRDGSEILRSEVLGPGATTAIATGVLESGGVPVVLYGLGATIHLIDPANGSQLGSWTRSEPVRSLQVRKDQDGCAVFAILQSSLERLDCATGTLVDARDLPTGSIFVHVPEGWDDDLIVSDGERVQRIRDDAIVAGSELLDSQLGEFNRGVVVVQPDGAMTTFVGGANGVYRVDLPVEEPLFEDGFE